jgi:multidrug efflux system membrane fusion protein
MMLRVLLCCGLLCSGNLLAMDLPAVLDWQQRIELGTLVDGMVTKVNVVPGQSVTRGSLLIELDQRDIQARLAWAESRAAAAKLQQDEARRELDRSLELYDRTLLSNHERIVAEIDAAKADAQALEADAKLTKVRLEREYSRIKAPFDGIVLSVMAQPGQMVVNKLQSIPLVTLVDNSRMKAVTEVDVNTVMGLRIGKLVKVGFREAWLEGEISWIGLEPSSKDASGLTTYAVEILLTAPDNTLLRAGEQAVVRIDE